MPPKKDSAIEVQPTDQKRPLLRRYRVQVDRQTKSSFDDKAAAEKTAAAIKKDYPVVQVSIYDSETETGRPELTLE